MLCLTRRVGEIIHIGNDITVILLGIYGRKVRLVAKVPQGMDVLFDGQSHHINNIPAQSNESNPIQLHYMHVFVGKGFDIGETIKVQLLKITGSQARIGTEAPEEIAIHRSEIYERIRTERAANDEDQAA